MLIEWAKGLRHVRLRNVIGYTLWMRRIARAND